jgi:hypothetical protein
LNYTGDAAAQNNHSHRESNFSSHFPTFCLCTALQAQGSWTITLIVEQNLEEVIPQGECTWKPLVSG